MPDWRISAPSPCRRRLESKMKNGHAEVDWSPDLAADTDTALYAGVKPRMTPPPTAFIVMSQLLAAIAGVADCHTSAFTTAYHALTLRYYSAALEYADGILTKCYARVTRIHYSTGASPRCASYGSRTPSLPPCRAKLLPYVISIGAVKAPRQSVPPQAAAALSNAEGISMPRLLIDMTYCRGMNSSLIIIKMMIWTIKSIAKDGEQDFAKMPAIMLAACYADDGQPHLLPPLPYDFTRL